MYRPQNRLILAFLAVVLMLSISACSSSESATSSSEDDKKEFKAATDVKGMITEGPGKLSGEKYSQSKLHAELDKLPDGMSAKEAYNHLIRLLAEDYEPYWRKMKDYQFEYKPGKTPGKNIENPESVDKKLNVAILLDASGSMAGQVSGEEKMTLAKQAVKEFAANLPEGANVSLRVYGHKGSNKAKDKERSCSSNDVVYPMGSYEQSKFESALDQFQATGWTPVASAIQQAKEDLGSKANSQAENLVYVVSDGKETCGGDPVKEAKKLNQSNIQAAVNIIGFDVNDEGQQQLKQAAQAGGGSYSTINSKEALDDYFERQREELSQKWIDWKNENGVDLAKKSVEVEHQVFLILDEKLMPMLLKENEQLQEAVDYLESKNKVRDSTDLSWTIDDRKDKLKFYFMDLEDKTTERIQATWKKKTNDIDNIEEKKQKEIEQNQ